VAVTKKDLLRAKRRALRVKGHIKRVSTLPRISVYKSLKYIYAQLIDDATQKTLASCSSLQLQSTGDKKARAHAVGLELAKRAKEQGVEAVVFDRGKFKYHGRIAAVAEGLREGGLKV
jgi:large subunit ribosomal protein L18